MILRKISILLIITLNSYTFSVAQVKDVEFPLAANEVRLSGYLESAIQNSLTNWNKGVVPYAELADFFRNGRKQFALGEMWGKAVRSACMFYRYTHDPELKRIIDATVQDILTTQQANGSISCVRINQQPDGSGGDLWERKYVMLALEEYYDWVNSDPRVLESLKRQADCLISQVGHAPKVEITDLGWSATNIGYEPCHIESSTLLEPIMRLYKHTGEKRYLDFATYIVQSGGTKMYNVFDQAFNNVEPYKMAGHYPKAYEMMSLFEGLVEYYRVTGVERWKTTALNMFNNIRTKEITIIGNAGADQPYHPNVAGEAWGNTAIEQTNPDITRMMETCVGVTWMKYCSQILRLTGDSKAVDEIERYVYNGLLGAMKPTGDGFSYVNLLNGPKVNDHGWGWHFGNLHVTCCNLNGPMGLAYIPFVAVMRNDKGLTVNLYNAVEVNTTTPSASPLNMQIVTDYPLSAKVQILVAPAQKEKFALQLRIPSWSEKTSVKVNGKKISVVAGQYATIDREWKVGDKIDIVFDMQCRLLDAPHGSNRKGDNFCALVYGPIVLARDENIDPNYNSPVTIKTDKNGIVNLKKTTPTLPSTRMEFIVPTTTGEIHLSDYASINGWDGKKVCTWLPR